MQKFIAALVATSLLASTCYAADDSMLAPGKPAGVARAQTSALETLGLITIGVAVVVGFALLTARTSALPSTAIQAGAGNNFTATTAP